VPLLAKLLLAYCAVALFAQAHLSQLSRYALPTFAVASPCVGYAAVRLSESARVLKAAVCLCLATVLACLLGLHLCRAVTSLPAAIGLLTAEELSAATFESHEAFEYLNESAFEKMVVATYGEPRLYGLDRPAVFADSGHNMLFPYGEMAGPEDLLRAFRERGITHVLVNPTYHPGVLVDRAADDRVTQYLNALASRGNLRLVHGTPYGTGKSFVLRVVGGG
jgi:hypothetical protein